MISPAPPAAARTIQPLPAPAPDPPGAGGSHRIVYDGLNLALRHGTGIATYARLLAHLARRLGYEVGIVYGTSFKPRRDPVLQDVMFFNQMSAANRNIQKPRRGNGHRTLIERLRCQFTLQAQPVQLGKYVVAEQFSDELPELDRAFVVRNLFENATAFFNWTGRETRLAFDPRPDLFHCTYPMPVRSVSSCNLYTVHDLIPLRLPFVTNDHKRHLYTMLKAVMGKADHIVTVSEASKQDIVKLLGIPESRITNTYEAVALPQALLDRPDAAVGRCIEGLYGLEMHGYLLFFGALEPKKNVARLMDAYMLSGVDLPLVLVTGRGWQNAAELERLAAHEAQTGNGVADGPSIRRFDYLDRSTLVNFIRGARAVVFPSLYEGFGLPALEAMLLGTPVVCSTGGGLGEVVGDAALTVDPYDVDDIARGIRTIAHDADLRQELVRRGKAQAGRFSIQRYRERVEALYAALV